MTPHKCGVDALQTASNTNIGAGRRDDAKNLFGCVLLYGVELPKPAHAMNIGARWRVHA